jgi:hypothetical protein
MVDREARSDLATSLLRLVSGEMTNDEFDRGYDGWRKSPDVAITEIAKFGWGLYSDLHPYKLKGRNAVSGETRQMAQRALLFLETDREYEWPPNVEGPAPFLGLFGPGCYLVLGLLLFVAALPQGGVLGLLGGLIALLPVAVTFMWLFTYRSLARDLERFRQSGDVHLRQADFDEARHARRPR